MTPSARLQAAIELVSAIGEGSKPADVIVQQYVRTRRYIGSKDRRAVQYWIDGLTDWDPFLHALSHEEFVVREKLAALADWTSKPTMLFAKTGRFVMLRGIHHIKLVISENRLEKAKAYVYMVLSGALSSEKPLSV